MSIESKLPRNAKQAAAPPAHTETRSPVRIPARTQARVSNRLSSVAPFRVQAYGYGQNQETEPQRQAELFYLQKQIQSQTPMVLVLEDGELLEGCIEWYDRHAIKVRGRAKTLVYKAAIKYMYKLGDQGQ